MEESKDTFRYKEWKKTERQYKQRDNSLLRMKETERQFKTENVRNQRYNSLHYREWKESKQFFIFKITE